MVPPHRRLKRFWKAVELSLYRMFWSIAAALIVCSFERTQGLTDSYWDRETVRSRLEERIVKAYQQTAAVAKELGVSYRDAAWVNALRKIEKAMLVRGWAWDQPK